MLVEEGWEQWRVNVVFLQLSTSHDLRITKTSQEAFSKAIVNLNGEIYWVGNLGEITLNTSFLTCKTTVVI